MTENVDILIVGAGIIGASAAWQLARRAPRARILVLDKGAGPGEGSTGASSAICRYRYTHPEAVALATDGIHAYQNWATFIENDAPLASYHRHGVLWLGDGSRERSEAEAARLSRSGVRVEVLDDGTLRERFPSLNACISEPDLVTGEGHVCIAGGHHLFESDGGYVDPMDALQDLISAGRERGIDIRFRAEVASILRDGDTIIGATLRGGDRIHCGTLINASGPWCNRIFAMAGLECPWPLKPTRVQIAYLDRPPEVDGDLPVCCDLKAGIYFRPQNQRQRLIVGSVLEKDEREVVADPDTFAKYADDDFVRTKLHALAHRLPDLVTEKNVTGYSGLYTMNTTDVHPVVGATPLRGLYVANGCSGHGFKLAPAIGSLLAQAITGERIAFDTAVPPSFLAFDRAPIRMASKNVLA